VEVDDMSSSIDPYAELASLFLTDDADGPPAAIPIGTQRSDVVSRTTIRFGDDESGGERPRGGSPDRKLESGVASPIEIALVGNLPVMGGLWLTQYADQVARREGPTALIRLERGQVTFELLRSPAHRGLLDAAKTAEDAIAELTRAAKRWIVCPGSEAALDGPLVGDALSPVATMPQRSAPTA
jgi:hypothetical protein